MSVDKKEVIRFRCPDCNALLQGEIDEKDDFVVSVYESGKPMEPGKKDPVKTLGEFIFGKKPEQKIKPDGE